MRAHCSTLHHTETHCNTLQHIVMTKDNQLTVCTAYCICSVMSSFSIRPSSLGLFCHVPLKRDQGDWDWRLRFNDTPNAIGCTFRRQHTFENILPLLWKHKKFSKVSCIGIVKSKFRRRLTFENLHQCLHIRPKCRRGGALRPCPLAFVERIRRRFLRRRHRLVTTYFFGGVFQFQMIFLSIHF